MKILVTGSSGFYGSHLIDLLLKETDAEIYGIDNLHRLEDFPVDPFEIIEDKEKFNERFVNWEMDYRDLKAEKIDEVGIDTIIHLAALVSIPESMQKPMEYFESNEMGTFSLCQELLKTKSKPFLIYASSPEVYGNPVYTPMDTDHPCHPRSFYAATKLAAEKQCMVLHEWYKYPVSIIRNFNTYGENQSNSYRGYAAVVPEFVTRALKNENIKIHGNGKQTRDLMYVKDAVEAYVRVMNKREKTQGEVFNIGTGIQTSVLDLAKKIIDISGSSSELVYESGRAADLERLEADCSKTEKLLKWKPVYSIDKGLDITISWFKKLLE
tara:strand:+ start:235 stop:1209 length:975 start_codon:yes stop_codon:yes gene_type:complete